MEVWWNGLTSLNQWFFISSVFFSVLSLWQVLGVALGMGGHLHLDGDHGGGHHVNHAENGDDRDAFGFLSVRSIIAFGTLFSWAGALYIMEGTHPLTAVLYASAWGISAMFFVSYLLYRLLHLQEIGNPIPEDAIGQEGAVYIDIPPSGLGQIRVMFGGRVQYLKACSRSENLLGRGAEIRIIGVKDDSIFEVEVLKDEKGD